MKPLPHPKEITTGRDGTTVSRALKEYTLVEFTSSGGYHHAAVKCYQARHVTTPEGKVQSWTTRATFSFQANTAGCYDRPEEPDNLRQIGKDLFGFYGGTADSTNELGSMTPEDAIASIRYWRKEWEQARLYNAKHLQLVAFLRWLKANGYKHTPIAEDGRPLYAGRQEYDHERREYVRPQEATSSWVAERDLADRLTAAEEWAAIVNAPACEACGGITHQDHPTRPCTCEAVTAEPEPEPEEANA